MANKRALMRCLAQSLTWLKCTRVRVQKNAGRLWIAVDRLGHRFLNVMVGSRDTDTGQCLQEGVAHHDIGRIMTDDWQPYQRCLPPTLPTQSKAETFTVEDRHSLFRHFFGQVMPSIQRLFSVYQNVTLFRYPSNV